MTEQTGQKPIQEQNPQGPAQLMDKFVKLLGESSLRSKDYYKFVIGLATGTLILSLTFTKQLVPFPEYKLLLVIGWISLLLCVLSGVFLYSKYDELSQHTTSLGDTFFSRPNNPIVIAANRKELEDFFLRHMVKAFLDSWIQSASADIGKERELKELKELREKVDLLKKETLKEFADKVQDIQVRLIKDADGKELVKQVFREFRKFISFFSRCEDLFYIPRMVKRVRVNLLKIIYGERIMRYSFFMGIVAISLFSIVNFIYTPS